MHTVKKILLATLILVPQISLAEKVSVRASVTVNNSIEISTTSNEFILDKKSGLFNISESSGTLEVMTPVQYTNMYVTIITEFETKTMFISSNNMSKISIRLGEILTQHQYTNVPYEVILNPN